MIIWLWDSVHMIAQFHHLLCCIKMLKVEAWILRAPPAKIPQTNSKQIFIDKVCKKKEFEISEACSLHHVGYCNTGWHNSSQTLLHQFLLHQLTTYWCFTFTVPCPAIPSVKCTPAPTHPHEQREENSSKISLCGRRMDLNTTVLCTQTSTRTCFPNASRTWNSLKKADTMSIRLILDQGQVKKWVLGHLSVKK